MSFLSDEQMSVAMFGIPQNAHPSWKPVELPVGRQHLPGWAKGLHVDLALPYCNSPRFQLKCNRALREWDGKTFTKDGDRYMAVSDDGRAEVYYQGGGLAVATLKRYRTGDGKLHAYAPFEPQRADHVDEDTGLHWNGHKPVPGEWVEIERLCTRQEQGFGGSHIDLVLDDGRELTLRGPWHGACPAGFVEVSYIDTSTDTSSGWFRRRPWHARGGVGGLFMTEDAFLPIFATFAPHMLAAHVDMGRGPRLEAYTYEWGEPKAWMQAREQYARKLARFEAMPLAERPPHVMCDWPKVCGGKKHCAVATCNHCTRSAA